jgi:hypothetical protein
MFRVNYGHHGHLRNQIKHEEKRDNKQKTNKNG